MRLLCLLAGVQFQRSKRGWEEFPAGPVVRTLHCQYSIPDWGTKIPHAMLCDQKKKKEKKKQGRQETAKHNAASLAQGRDAESSD